MLLQSYKDKNLLINSNFLEETSGAGTFGYRGELVLVEGEAGDDKGHAKPPVEVMRGAVLLAGEKMKLVVGALDDIANVQSFLDKYLGDLDATAKVLMYVVNISKPFQVAIDGISLVCMPLQVGVPWNEALEELRLEKSDFKGQSPADKIVTLFDEMQSWKPSCETISLEEALGRAEDIKRETYGAI